MPNGVHSIAGCPPSSRNPQSPHTPLEEIVADADLDLLGRSNFLERNQDLRKELAAYGTTQTDYQWYTDQLDFLQNHRYWTAAARALRDEQKHRNIVRLTELLAQCHAP